VVAAGQLGFVIGRHVLGFRRGCSVPDHARSRSDISDFCYRRHVCGRSGNQRLAPAEPSCVPALGELAHGRPLLPSRDNERVCVRRDDSGVCSCATAAGLHLNRFFTETIRLRFHLGAANLQLQAEMAEREATEAALRQAQKLEAIGQLTGGISHDFNNLLTIVTGNLELAIGKEKAGDSRAILPQLQGALQAAERGVTLIHRLLAFARKQRLDPRSVDLNRLVMGIEELLHHTLGDGVRIEIRADDDLAPARADANQLELALVNLAINARDAMPDGGILRIGLRNSGLDRDLPPELSLGEYVVVSVSDTGTGMDETTLARAFEPFFTTKRIGSGSGLGLPMVQGFAAQSGGAVRIQSKLGEGTTVELWLPRADEPPDHAASEEQ
jgi:signal transduction histidine kinase